MTSTLTPARPVHLDDTAHSALLQRSTALVTKVQGETSELQVGKMLSAIGSEAQERLAGVNGQIGNRAKNIALQLGGDGDDSKVPQLISELSTTMAELNPHSLMNAWWFRWLPSKRAKRFFVSRFAAKFGTEKGHIDTILNGLRSGKDALIEEDIDLEAQYKVIETAQLELKELIYLCQLISTALTERRTGETDPGEQRKLDAAINKVARRQRDLNTIVVANEQFLLTITGILESNGLLKEQTDSILVVAPSVLTNALQVHRSLLRQKEVAKAVKQAQDTMGGIMVENASALRLQTDEIARLYNNPVIGLEQLERSRDELMAAVKTADEAIATSTVKARQISEQLVRMEAELAPISDARWGAREETTVPALAGTTEEGNK